MNFATRTIGFSAALLVLIGVASVAPGPVIPMLGTFGLIGALFGGLWLASKHSPRPQRGAVTITFQYPVIGIVAPLPANFPNGYNTVRGNVIATANGDTTAEVTHNFALSAGALAAGQPEVSMVPLNVAFYASQWIAAYTDGNNITFTKLNSAGGAGPAQLGFFFRRPHSIAI